MSNKKQTAVDKLHSRILFNIGLDDNDIKELARLASECMNYEKERIIDAYNQGEFNQGCNGSAEDYYNETFNTKEK
jgi:hypothetical protein